jgi:hypothetical protein
MLKTSRIAALPRKRSRKLGDSMPRQRVADVVDQV